MRGTDSLSLLCKISRAENPVDLVSHVGPLLLFEMHHHRAAGKPSAHRERLSFRFNPGLISASYVLPAIAQQSIDDENRRLRACAQDFVDHARLTKTFFPELLNGSQEQQDAARDEAELELASSTALIPLYSNLESPPGEVRLPPSELLTEDWALYRWLQVKILFGLDLYVRYQGHIPGYWSPGVYERLEHDVLDTETLMLGCLQGALATREKKLKRWFRLLCPGGRLFE